MIWFPRFSAAVAVLLALNFFPTKILAAETADEILSICERVTVAAADVGGQLHFDPTFEAGRCWGAFAAVQGLSRIKTGMSLPPILGICAPENTTRQELIRTFSNYVRTHPEFRSQDFAVVVVIALRSRYGCGATS
jgi:hypothetical protein